MDLPHCSCVEEPRPMAEVRTSFTEANLGRRFLGCSKWDPEQEGGGSAHCGYFRWYDRPVELPLHIRALILGLKADNRNQRRNAERLRLENDRLRLQVRTGRWSCWSFYKFAVVVIALFIGIVVASSSGGDGRHVPRLG